MVKVTIVPVLFFILGQLFMATEIKATPSEQASVISPEQLVVAKTHSDAGCRLRQESDQISFGQPQETSPLPRYLVMSNPFESGDQLQSPPSLEKISPSSDQFAFPQLRDLQERINDAKYPRIGQAWARADNLSEDNESTIARHDLYFDSAESFGLQWKKTAAGESAELDPCSVEVAKEKRARLLAKNPNMVMLAEIRYHDAKNDLFPSNSPFWQHDGEHHVVNEAYPQYEKLDYTNPQFQDHVAAQARAAVQSGAVDGVMLDWWHDGKDEKSADRQAKLELLKKVRAAVGPDALIMINTNEYKMPDETTKLVNGYYMECSKTKDMHSDQDAHDEWKQIQDTLVHSEKNGRTPHINMVETWWEDGSILKRDEMEKMRATTTMVMADSNGYALFADPDRNGATEDHQHNWYSQFWNANVGEPLAAGSTLADGTSRREFQNATVVSNATGDHPVQVKFPQDRKRASDGRTLKAGEEYTIKAHDGEIFLYKGIVE